MKSEADKLWDEINAAHYWGDGFQSAFNNLKGLLERKDAEIQRLLRQLYMTVIEAHHLHDHFIMSDSEMDVLWGSLDEKSRNMCRPFPVERNDV